VIISTNENFCCITKHQKTNPKLTPPLAKGTWLEEVNCSLQQKPPTSFTPATLKLISEAVVDSKKYSEISHFASRSTHKIKYLCVSPYG
jgi:hypothetical protein